MQSLVFMTEGIWVFQYTNYVQKPFTFEKIVVYKTSYNFQLILL